MAKNSSGWLIPVIILTLPGFMFYFWWSHLGGEAHKASLMGKLRAASVQRVFNVAPPAARFSNPISASGSQVAPASKAPVAKISAVPSAPAYSIPAKIAPSSVSAHSPALVPSAVGVAAKKPMLAASDVLSPLEIKRDPTLSPEDRREIQEMLAPKPPPRKTVRRKQKPKKKEPPIETLIDLEGIIFVSPTNVKAIVNGQILHPGESVKGAKILSIFQKKVIFSYRGRQFVKVMSGKL